MTTPNRQESAAERARELLVALLRSDRVRQVGLSINDMERVAQALEQAQRDLAAATERADKLAADNEALKKELSGRPSGACTTPDCNDGPWSDGECWTCPRCTQKLRADLTTSRAATDKTRQEADALMEQVPRWRPIESAPKDGAPLLCLIPGRFTAPRMRVLRWKADRWVLDGQSDNDFYQPSHWMPLPLPPKETT